MINAEMIPFTNLIIGCLVLLISGYGVYLTRKSQQEKKPECWIDRDEQDTDGGHTIIACIRNWTSGITIDEYSLPSGGSYALGIALLIPQEDGRRYIIQVAYYEKAPLKAKLKKIGRNHYRLVLY